MLARQLLVHLAERIDLIIDARALFGIKEDFDNLMPVLLGADAFAHNLSGVDEVREDRVVDGGEGARSRALLGDTAATRGEWEDTALGDKQDVAVGEFLLELAGESNLKLLLAEWWVGFGKRMIKYTFAGLFGTRLGGEPGRRQQSPFCHGQLQAVDLEPSR